MTYDLIVIGGGAAGIFGAIAAKEASPSAKVIVLEKTAVLLSKVRISGGGRCNVTHACFDPKLLAQNYPRGYRELIGPFNRFQPKETIEWFESRGVKLKTEADGRIFPTTNSSQTIIDCLLSCAKNLDIKLILKSKIERISKEGDQFHLFAKDAEYTCSKLLLTTGSSQEGYAFAKDCGHSIIEPAPSLFTFNVPTSPLKELSGISFEKITIALKDSPFSQTGALLITHFGFSGPAPLKLSAWAARSLFEKNYRAEIVINWLPDLSLEEIISKLFTLKQNTSSKKTSIENIFNFPKSFWNRFLELTLKKNRIQDVAFKDLQQLANQLHQSTYLAEGKTTHKEEFVTCGGIALKEVNFKKMESKLCPNLFFAGEILDIDGVTGGFNFQNAWTTGYIAGNSVVLNM